MSGQGVLAIIPARSGSKSLLDKNIRMIAGKPLLAWSIEHALACRHITRIVVSTDNERYARLAREHGAETPFLRPPELAGDTTPDVEVFLHALHWLEENEDYCPELCVHLRPTAPVRDPDDIDSMIQFLREHSEFSSARTISEVLHPPFKMWYRNDDGTLRPVVASVSNISEPWNKPRQTLPVTYIQTASIDVLRAEVITQQHSMTGHRVYGHVVKEFFDIDTSAEFERADAELNRTRGTQDHDKVHPLPHPRRTFCFDIDGVIASLSPACDYRLARPAGDIIALVNSLYRDGHRILLFTARGSASGIDWHALTKSQLAAWQVQYHELHFGKPAADYYIDDRMLALADLRAFVHNGELVRT